MSVFRIERTKNYTVMSNYHLRDQSLSLKAKGLLSQMLSLPENWDYTLAGLSHINRESKDAIRTALQELEKAGYIIRERERDSQGRLRGADYIIHESPITKSDEHTSDKLEQESKNIQNTDRQSMDSISSSSVFQQSEQLERKCRKVSSEDIEVYREVIAENISYDLLKTQVDSEDLDEILELVVETVCSNQETIRVAGSNFPHDVVKSRLLKLNDEHIRFVIHCIKENTTKIRNIKQYLLTALFNAPVTISNYHSALFNYINTGVTNPV